MRGGIRVKSTSITRRKGLRRILTKYWDLYLLLLPVLAYYIIFCYIPMYGVQIAFHRYSFSLGIWGSEWVGLLHFRRFFASYNFARLMKTRWASACTHL